jgi:hypothetical protein
VDLPLLNPCWEGERSRLDSRKWETRWPQLLNCHPHLSERDWEIERGRRVPEVRESGWVEP